jgi:hypothetical protein
MRELPESDEGKMLVLSLLLLELEVGSVKRKGRLKMGIMWDMPNVSMESNIACLTILNSSNLVQFQKSGVKTDIKRTLEVKCSYHAAQKNL